MLGRPHEVNEYMSMLSWVWYNYHLNIVRDLSLIQMILIKTIIIHNVENVENVENLKEDKVKEDNNHL